MSRDATVPSYGFKPNLIQETPPNAAKPRTQVASWNMKMDLYQRRVIRFAQDREFAKDRCWK